MDLTRQEARIQDGGNGLVPRSAKRGLQHKIILQSIIFFSPFLVFNFFTHSQERFQRFQDKIIIMFFLHFVYYRIFFIFVFFYLFFSQIFFPSIFFSCRWPWPRCRSWSRISPSPRHPGKVIIHLVSLSTLDRYFYFLLPKFISETSFAQQWTKTTFLWWRKTLCLEWHWHCVG